MLLNKKSSSLMIATALAALAGGYWLSHKLAEPTQRPNQSAAPTLPSAEYLQALAAAQLGQGELTPEQIKEDAQMEREQVETAMQWLQDTDPEQRLTGAEQLSAYPSLEAEERLANALRADMAPEVRAAAAQSLDYFDNLRESTVSTLLYALKDPVEDVRFNALATLENKFQNLESGSVEAKKLRSGLKKISKSPQVAREIKEAIRDFLRDQA